IESLEERVHATEHRLYPAVLKEVLTKRIEKGE
ncbi:phosphoribosylglycinamide formyltransferase, partial [Limosilactobacillus fermentum]